jgi:transposase InsO family protein
MANEHNAKIPRDHWLGDDEKEAIIDYEREHPLEGYRRLAFMMLDDDVAAAAPATVYRVLKKVERLAPPSPPNDRKGKGFHQPRRPHRDWHVDISYINIAGTFYYLCSILDGYSRYIVHWEIREKMDETAVETIVQRARERFPGENPRIITDNGPQFIAKDFKQFIRICGMKHIRTSPYYPQSNGKIERWHKSLKSECIRPQVPLSLDDARRLVGQFVEHYNTARLHSSIGYVAPADKLLGLEDVIHAQRDRKLEEAREVRRLRRKRHPNVSTGADSTQTKPATKQSESIDFRHLRGQVTMESVLDALGYLASMHGAGPQRRGPCPLHDAPHERHRSFSVHLDKGVFRCFHPDCQAQGNVLDLWARRTGLPLHDAALDMADRFGIATEKQNQRGGTRTYCLPRSP